jgi:hypothetical protein
MSASYAANDEQVIANALAQAMGKTGAPRIYNYGSPDPQIPIAAIYCVQDCVLFSLTLYVNENSAMYSAKENQELSVDVVGESGGNISSITVIPAGTIIRGHIYSFILDSGLLIAYPA